MMDAAINSVRNPMSNKPVDKIYKKFLKATEEFSKRAYSDIRDVNAAETKHRGMSYTFEGNKILTFNVAGRIMVTLRNAKDEDTYVSLVGAEDSGDAGFHGVHGESGEILSLLKWFTENWNTVALKPTSDVAMI